MMTDQEFGAVFGAQRYRLERTDASEVRAVARGWAMGQIGSDRSDAGLQTWKTFRPLLAPAEPLNKLSALP